MKMNSAPIPDRNLDELLADWNVKPERNPAFRTAVRSKIETAAGPSSWPSYLRAHAAMSVGLLAVALTAGGWVGRERALARSEAERSALAESYVRALDARTMRMP